MAPFWSDALRERLTKLVFQAATTTTTLSTSSSTTSCSSYIESCNTDRVDELNNRNDDRDIHPSFNTQQWNKQEKELQSPMLLTAYKPHSHQKNDIITTTTTTPFYSYLDLPGRAYQQSWWWFQPYSSALHTVACESSTSTTGNSTSTGNAGTNSKSIIPKITIPTRTEQIQRLHNANTKEQSYDVVVIGGGATGCGIALDSSRRGYTTALLERGDFGTETSARSTKLIWAGIRYIATAVSKLLRWNNYTRPIDAVQDFMSEFKMVLGAHRERKIMMKNNPHLTTWIPIAIPIQNWILTPAPFGHPLFCTAPITLPFIMKFYDSLSGFTCPPSYIMKTQTALRVFPQLDSNVKYFQVFYEGIHNDSRTNTCIALTAAEHGATVANYVEMVGLITDPDTGKAIGVTCRDNSTTTNTNTGSTGTGRNHPKATFNVYAKSIIFAAGPFTDEVRMLEDPTSKPAVAAAAGTHIVLPGSYCPNNIGMLDINTSDGRFLFYLPWEGYTLVGTTDRKGPVTSYHGPPEEEIQWLLTEMQKYLSKDIIVQRSDVLSAWQGFRPLASDPNAIPGAPVSRDHIISTNPKTGVTFITGGKWVTYREMAKDVVDLIVRRSSDNNNNNNNNSNKQKIEPNCTTDQVVLRGGVGYDRNLPIQLVQKYSVSDNVAKHLSHTYGTYAIDVCEIGVSSSSTDGTVPSTTTTTTSPLKVLIDGYPYLECEIVYQCRYEMACTVKDMVSLRTRLAYLNKDAAIQVVPKIATIMMKELKWTKKQRDEQIKDAIHMIQTFGGPVPAVKK